MLRMEIACPHLPWYRLQAGFSTWSFQRELESVATTSTGLIPRSFLMSNSSIQLAKPSVQTFSSADRVGRAGERSRIRGSELSRLRASEQVQG